MYLIKELDMNFFENKVFVYDRLYIYIQQYEQFIFFCCVNVYLYYIRLCFVSFNNNEFIYF